MKSKIIWIVVVVVVGGLVWMNLNRTASGEPIKIGATLSLTGNLAFIGQSEKNGLILASEEINKKGGIKGRPLEIIAEDNQGDAKLAVGNVQKFMNVDNVDLVFSAFTHITKAVSPIVKERNIPMIYASTDGTIAQESNLFFRDYFDAEQGAVVLFRKVQSDGQKNIKVISEKQDGCLLFVEVFKKQTKSTDIKILGETYFQSTENDFRTHLTKLNLKQDDALLVCAFRHAHLVMKNMSDLELLGNQTYHFVGPFLPVSNEIQYREMYSKNRAVSTWYGFAEVDNTKKQDEYIKKYRARFSVEPIPDSAYSYDAAYIIAGALEKCLSGKTLDKKCFEEKMLDTDYEGVAGRVIFDEEGRSFRETILIQAENNQWRTVK